MQQPKDNESSGFQSKLEIDDVIEEMQMLMRKTSMKRYTKRKRITTKGLQLTEAMCISREKGKEKCKGQSDKELETIKQQQHNKEKDQLQTKNWDPRG